MTKERRGRRRRRRRWGRSDNICYASNDKSLCNTEERHTCSVGQGMEVKVRCRETPADRTCGWLSQRGADRWIEEEAGTHAHRRQRDTQTKITAGHS